MAKFFLKLSSKFIFVKPFVHLSFWTIYPNLVQQEKNILSRELENIYHFWFEKWITNQIGFVYLWQQHVNMPVIYYSKVGESFGLAHVQQTWG